jgi:hypothetical protein
MRSTPRLAYAVLLVCASLGSQAAYGGPCFVSGPRYALAQDTLNWSMKVESGKTCSRDFKLNSALSIAPGGVAIEEVKLVSPPQSGLATVQGSSFTYAARTGFQGPDSFTISVSGSIRTKPGSSLINVAVSVLGEQGGPPPARSRPTPLSIRQAPSPPAEPVDDPSAGGEKVAAGGDWLTLKIGGGGFVTGISIAPDGTKAIRTDTYGGYVWSPDAGSWQQVMTSNSMPRGAWGLGVNDSGIYEIVVCPSQTTKLYMMPRDGFVYVSTDSGGTWTRTGFPRATGIDPNDSKVRTMGRFMAVDPANPNILFVGTPTQGLWVTRNGGTTFSQITAVGNGTVPTGGSEGGGHVIAFDPSSNVSEGATQGVYATTYGTGLYHSGDGGSSWTLIDGSPTTHEHMIVDQEGTVWFTDNTNRVNLHKYDKKVWVSIDPGANPWWSIAVDPADINHVVLVSYGGYIAFSSDRGAKWSFPSARVTLEGDQPWAATSGVRNPFISTSDIQFDPSLSSVVYLSEGFGVLHANPFASASAITFTSQVSGIEQVVSTKVLAPPGSDKILLGAQDYPVWYKPVSTLNDNADSLRPGYIGISTIVAGYAFDYAPSAPAFIVGLMNQSWGAADYSGYSTDSGNTWHKFPSVPPPVKAGQMGGNIAAASTSNFVWIPNGNNQAPFFTTDGGASWTASIGLRASFNFATYLFGRFLAADKVNVGTYYAYAPEQLNASPGPGVYKSTDGGASFSQVYGNALDNPHGGYAMVWKVSPTVGGDIFYSSGYQAGSAHPVHCPLLRSTNGGSTWSVIPGFREVIALGFGAAFPGQSNPTIAAVGWYKNVFGIWQSADNGLTWLKIGDYPQGNFMVITDIDGDKMVAGQWYVAVNGSGFKYRRPAP